MSAKWAILGSGSLRAIPRRTEWAPHRPVEIDLALVERLTQRETAVTREAYGRFDEINALFEQMQDTIDRYRLPVSLKTLGAKGSMDWRSEPIHSYRDLWEIDDRTPQLAWLWQLNRGVFKSPSSKWESWTTSIAHSDDDVQRYVDNFEEFAAAITA